jgi:hypothetical protein
MATRLAVFSDVHANFPAMEVVAHSVLLLTFGVDSIIELASAGPLYFRLAREARAAPGNIAGGRYRRLRLL